MWLAQRLAGKSVNPAADYWFQHSNRFILTKSDQVSDPYTQNAWVYAGVKALAEAVASTPARVEERVQTGSENGIPLYKWLDLPDEPILRLLMEPSTDEDYYSLWEATVSYYLLKGAVIWVLIRGTETMPTDIAVYPPDQFTAEVDERSGKILGWIYTHPVSQEKEEINRRDVIYFKDFHPWSAVDGLSPITPAMSGINQDHRAGQYNQAFFENMADPCGIIETEQDMTDAEYDRQMKRWESRQAGAPNAKRTAILSGGLKYKPLQMSFRDMEFLNQRKWHLRQMLATLRIPLNEVLPEEGSYAAARVWDRAFWTKAVVPLQNRLMAKINATLVRQVYGTNRKVRMVFDRSDVPALQEELKERVEMAHKLVMAQFAPNHVKELLHLSIPDTTWGEHTFVDFSAIPADSIVPKLEEGVLPDEEDIDRIFEREKLEQEREEEDKSLEARINSRLRRYLIEDLVQEAFKLIESENGSTMPTAELDRKLKASFLSVAEDFSGAVSCADKVLVLNRRFEEAIRAIPDSLSLGLKRRLVRRIRNKTLELIRHLAHNAAAALTKTVDTKT